MIVIRPPRFQRRAKLAGLSEYDIVEIIRFLAERPNAGAVIPGAGGARKVRIRLSGRGKRGGARAHLRDCSALDRDCAAGCVCKERAR